MEGEGFDFQREMIIIEKPVNNQGGGRPLWALTSFLPNLCLQPRKSV